MFAQLSTRSTPSMPPLIRQLSNARSRYFLTSSGLNLEYRQKGDPFAETIVMLHGLGSDCRIFLPNIDPLAESYQVVVVSLRGHGLSDKPKSLDQESFSLDLLVRDLIELTWSLGIQSFHLVGHGLGAVIGYELMNRDPGSLDSMISIESPATPEGGRSALKILQKATGFSSRFGNHKKTAESIAKMCSTNMETIAFLKDEVFYATDWEIAKLIKDHLQAPDYIEIIRDNPAIPVSFISGLDPSVEKTLGNYKSMARTVAELKEYEHASIITMEDLGYFPNLDSPARFHETIQEILKGVASM